MDPLLLQCLAKMVTGSPTKKNGPRCQTANQFVILHVRMAATACLLADVSVLKIFEVLSVNTEPIIATLENFSSMGDTIVPGIKWG